MPNWIEHVKAYQTEHGCSYKEALKGASSTYTKKTTSKDPQKPKKKTTRVITAEADESESDSDTYL